MKHFASAGFWESYRSLPENIQRMADRSFGLLKQDPDHPSLHFKNVGKYRAARVGIHYRTLAIEQPDGLLWFWIGPHSEYDRIIG
ncbi:hypothetical protein HY256_08805 [Candidatus Sumerlaeota bacterium]|nr:hypothetical protein [Candidatus Sumerlaeota bacterium]